MSDIFYGASSIRGILTCELRNRKDEHILKMGLDKLQNILDQCKIELTKQYGSWEKAGDSFVSLINDMDDLSHIILDEKYDFLTNVRVYLCDALAYKLDEFEEIWKELDVE